MKISSEKHENVSLKCKKCHVKTQKSLAKMWKYLVKTRHFKYEKYLVKTQKYRIQNWKSH